jgi:hypothetical protein
MRKSGTKVTEQNGIDMLQILELWTEGQERAVNKGGNKPKERGRKYRTDFNDK